MEKVGNEIIEPDFGERGRGYPVIRKEVDGEIIECVNIDALTPSERKAWEVAQAKLRNP